MKWKLKRLLFIANRMIQGDSYLIAKMQWTYYCLDVATLTAFPDTKKHQLPSNAINPSLNPNRGLIIKAEDKS